MITHYFHTQKSIVGFLVFFHTVIHTVAIPKIKIVKQEPQQQATPKEAERTDFTPIRPQSPLLNQQDDTEKY